MKHQHYECIVAWAEGKQIQLKDINNEWVDIPYREPQWDIHVEYRIKPTPKEDTVRYLCILTDYTSGQSGYKLYSDNLKLTFDGETGKLKLAEVIK
jgi:ubiquitin